MNVVRTIIIKNQKGLHARPSGQIMKILEKANAELSIQYQGKVADASSILDLLLLAAPQGAELELTATGQDAEKVMEQVLKLVENKFGE